MLSLAQINTGIVHGSVLGPLSLYSGGLNPCHEV